MSALSEMRLSDVMSITPLDTAVPPAWWLEAMAMIFYRWADAHRHDVVVKKRILLFTVTITVGDCEKLVEYLVGPRPVVTS